MRIKFAFLLLASSLYSAPNIEQIKNDVSILEKDNKNISTNITRSKANSSDDVLVATQNSTEINFGIPPQADSPKAIKEVPKDIMYFHLLQKFETTRDAIALTPVRPTKVNAFALKPIEQTANSQEATSSEKIAKQEPVMSFKGFCQFDNVYDISQKMDVNIPCKIDGKMMLLNLSLVPNNTNYQLNGVANFLLHDELNNGTYSKRIFLDPTMSSVKNSTANSTNIATYYDSRNIDKLMGIGAREMASALSRGTQDTYQEYRDYNTKENVNYDQNGNVIVTRETQKPDIVNNVAYATVEGVFRVIEKGVEMLNVESLPALYQITKGSIINVELYSKTESAIK